MALPKFYRKKKGRHATDMAKFKPNAGGGKVAGVIIGPASSIGPPAASDSHPHTTEGNERGGNVKE